jgi:hypothetical protein
MGPKQIIIWNAACLDLILLPCTELTPPTPSIPTSPTLWKNRSLSGNSGRITTPTPSIRTNPSLQTHPPSRSQWSNKQNGISAVLGIALEGLTNKWEISGRYLFPWVLASLMPSFCLWFSSCFYGTSIRRMRRNRSLCMKEFISYTMRWFR